jgi:hypothetical protein
MTTRPLAVATAGTAVAWLGNRLGLWWLTLVVGIAVGLALRRRRTALWVALLAGLLGWGLELVALALTFPLRPTAEAVSAILGAPGIGGTPAVALTLGLGALLAGLGMWLGSALRAAISPVPPGHDRSRHSADQQPTSGGR